MVHAGAPLGHANESHDEEDDVENGGGIVLAVEEEGDVDEVGDDPEVPGLEDFAIGEILGEETERGCCGINPDELALYGLKNCGEEGYENEGGEADDDPVFGLNVGDGEFWLSCFSCPFDPAINEVASGDEHHEYVAVLFGFGKEIVSVCDCPDQADGIVEGGLFDDEIDPDDTGNESDEFDSIVEISGERLDGEAKGKGLGEDANEIGSGTNQGSGLPGGELHGVGFTW